MRDTPRLIRPADLEDAAGIAEVQVSAWRAAYQELMPKAYLDSMDAIQRTEIWRRIAIDPEVRVIVAVDDGHLIGFCCSCPSRDEDGNDRTAEITSLYLHPRWWRRGWGSELCHGGLRQARLMGASEVTLWVLSGNYPARRFYEKMGFHFDGREKNQHGPGFELQSVRYRLRLHEA